ncbi:MAG: helix-turn-helix transcriptional regulator [Bacteroidaceae bacterium]|nr:helix-turn-helix transcriptional regulator [Bacteroidaceae bacterium]
MTPRIAIIAQNTLSAIGLASLIEQMMPVGEVCMYESLSELARATGAGYNAADDPFVHYFITAQTLLEHARFFLPRRMKTIVLVQGTEAAGLPEGFVQIDVAQSRDQLLKQLMTLHAHAHGSMSKHPHHLPAPHDHAPRRDTARAELAAKPLLTRRETDVLRSLVRGKSNKEVAEALGIGITTVITHRNNLTTKLGTRSLAALTVYAVSHGIIGVEEISTEN